MSEVRRNALVPYSAHEMFSLVDDIDLYPEFLPWCKSAKIHSRSSAEVEASLELHKSGISKVFTTRNSLVADTSIKIELLNGPFSELDGMWIFHPLGDQASKVEFNVNFEFSNPVMRIFFGPYFKVTCSSLVDSFRRRAEVVYGKR